MYIAIYMFSISVYPSGYYNNVTRDPKISGNFYGSCTCPDGKKYYAGDNNNLCSTLACYGGTSGNCKKQTHHHQCRIQSYTVMFRCHMNQTIMTLCIQNLNLTLFHPVTLLQLALVLLWYF